MGPKMAPKRPEAHFGGLLGQVGGKMLGKMATKRQLGGNLGHLKANLRTASQSTARGSAEWRGPLMLRKRPTLRN